MNPKQRLRPERSADWHQYQNNPCIQTGRIYMIQHTTKVPIASACKPDSSLEVLLGISKLNQPLCYNSGISDVQ